MRDVRVRIASLPHEVLSGFIPMISASIPSWIWTSSISLLTGWKLRKNPCLDPPRPQSPYPRLQFEIAGALGGSPVVGDLPEHGSPHSPALGGSSRLSSAHDAIPDRGESLADRHLVRDRGLLVGAAQRRFGSSWRPPPRDSLRFAAGCWNRREPHDRCSPGRSGHRAPARVAYDGFRLLALPRSSLEKSSPPSCLNGRSPAGRGLRPARRSSGGSGARPGRRDGCRGGRRSRCASPRRGRRRARR